MSMILLVFANAGSFFCETDVQNFINQIVLLCLRVVDLFHVLSFPPEKETTGSARSENKSAHRERLSPIRQSNGNMPALRYETSCALYVHSGLFMMITFGRRLFACIFFVKCDILMIQENGNLFRTGLDKMGRYWRIEKSRKCVAFSALDKLGQNWTCKKLTEREHGYENDV